MTEKQISEFGLTWGLGLMIAFMLFIIWDLARQSNAGKLGTFVLFFVLAFGMLGVVANDQTINANLVTTDATAADIAFVNRSVTNDLIINGAIDSGTRR